MHLAKLIAGIIVIGIFAFFIYTLGIYFKGQTEKYGLNQQKPATKLTEKNEPAGLKDIVWDQSLNTVKNLKKVQVPYRQEHYFQPYATDYFTKLHISYQRFCMFDYGRLYERPGDALSFGSAKVENIRYVFVGGKFNAAIVRFNGLENYGILKTHFFKEYQPAEVTKGVEGSRVEMYRWKGKKTGIAFYYDQESEEGTVIIHLWQKFTAKTITNAPKFQEEALKGEAEMAQPN